MMKSSLRKSYQITTVLFIFSLSYLLLQFSGNENSGCYAFTATSTFKKLPQNLIKKTRGSYYSKCLRVSPRDCDHNVFLETTSQYSDERVSSCHENENKTDDESKLTVSSHRRALLQAIPLLPFIILSTTAAPPSSAYVSSSEPLKYQPSPINRRSGTTLTLTETSLGYNLAFITYLSRFLLTYDGDCQSWWRDRRALSPISDETKLRRELFARFSASVEVGLQRYPTPAGPATLLSQLCDRFTPRDTAVAEDGSTREMARQLALLFGLLDAAAQPIPELMRLLARVENATVSTVTVLEGGRGYDALLPLPEVVAEDPLEEGGARAQFLPRMIPTGSILRIDWQEIEEVSKGLIKYSYPSVAPPVVTISPPMADGEAATAVASVTTVGLKRGRVKSITIVSPGKGYTASEDITVTLSPPPSISFSNDNTVDNTTSIVITAKAVLECKVGGIDIVNGGYGYPSAGIPINITIAPPLPNESNGPLPLIPARATALATSPFDSYISLPSPSSSSPKPNLPNLPSAGVSLLPSGYGVTYNLTKKCFTVGRRNRATSSLPPLDPDFGPRGRSPIERERRLQGEDVLRFFASGASCCAIAHVVLTPIDVVKTKIQTDPKKYPSLFPALQTITKDEGPGTLLTGWQQTLLGYFAAGGVQYTTTEFVRRFLTETTSSLPNAPPSSTLEIPIILTTAALAASLGAVVIAPFEAVRIRNVAEPSYAPSVVGVAQRMVREEGALTLFDSVPAFLAKDVPFICAKFLVFYTLTGYLYTRFPSAADNLSESLVVSLVGGAVGGLVAAVVSNPADATISEMKRSKKTNAKGGFMGILDVAIGLVEQDEKGWPALFRGLGLRMVFFAVLVSLQFLLYDFIRISLGVGVDDLKLYLDVLGGALGEN